MKRSGLSLFIACAAVSLSIALPQTLPIRWKKLSDVRKGHHEYHVSYPIFGGGGNVAKIANTHFANDAIATMQEGRKALKDGLFGDMLYTLDSSVDIGIARADLISGCINYGDFMGGAHPNHTFKPATFGLVNAKAKRLKLIDLCKSKAARDLIKSKIVVPKLQSQKKERDGAMDWELPDIAMEQFLVTPAGITWLFPPYMVGPYVEGDYTIKVPFSELRLYLNEKGPLKGLLKD